MGRKGTLQVVVSPALEERVKWWSEREGRSLSNMAARLIEEALEARRKNGRSE